MPSIRIAARSIVFDAVFVIPLKCAVIEPKPEGSSRDINSRPEARNI